MGRPTSATKLAPEKLVKKIRTRGGNYKFRGLKLNQGNFVWKSQNMSKSVRIQQVMYNAANNEFVRRNLLSKGTVVVVDKAPFENQYKLNYPRGCFKRRKAKAGKWGNDDEGLQKTFSKREEPLLAMISTRAGQCGRTDGYLLEGKELDFYKRKIAERRKGASKA